jgi:flagellar biosynthesis protein FlhA
MMRSPTALFAAALLAVVAILVVPLPPPVLDLLLGLDLFVAAAVLLLSVTVENPLEFSAFAPALLLATLFRLALDVSATRLILTQGAVPGGVGTVIPAFGDFVVRGNLIVGLIVFAILAVIQFVVIAGGSQRVAEVAARFALDAMPGKQMAIDADVHAGVLDHAQARERRAAVQREADFFGAMDGAGKFVKGDATAAMIIVALDLLGGVAVGVFYHGMSPQEALQTFALLSIGNALVTTLPAFLISIAMGMMVTRVAGESTLGADLAAQVLARPEVLRGAGALLLALALVPSLPRAVFCVLGGCAFVAAQAAVRARARHDEAVRARRERERRAALRKPELALTLVGVDAIALEFGERLMPLMLAPASEALLDRVGEVRRALAGEIGIVLPGVRVRDDLTLPPDGYALRVRDRLVARGRLELDRLLAVGEEEALRRAGCTIEAEPVYGLPAAWIAPADRTRLQEAGTLVFDPVSVLGSHLAEIARAHAAELVGRQELLTLLEHLKTSVPALVKEIGGEALPLAVLQRAVGYLLRERVWPRDPIAVFEAILEAAPADARTLAEAARRVLVPDLLRRRGAAELDVVLLDPDLERSVAMTAEDGAVGSPAPERVLALRVRVAELVESRGGEPLAVVCTAAARPLLADILHDLGGVEVFSYAEIPPEVGLRALEVLGTPALV